MEAILYTPPRVRDLGTLRQFTADFDVNFIGSVVNVVTMAGASGVLVPNTPQEVGGGGGGGIPDAGEVLGEDRTIAEGGGPGSEGGGQGGAGEEGTGGGGGGAAVAPAPVEEGGRLPFTGFATMVVAGVGMALSGAGVAIRSKLRRNS